MELLEQQKEEELKRILSEKEEEMKLAIEERELQKMAALSQQDSASDYLKAALQEYQTVSGNHCIITGQGICTL